MLTRLAGCLSAHARAVLITEVVGAIIAGAFGASVASTLSPYGADDPSTQRPSAHAEADFPLAVHRPDSIAPGDPRSVGQPARRAPEPRLPPQRRLERAS